MSEEVEIELSSLLKNKYFWPAVICIVYLVVHVPLINSYQTVWWDEAQYLLMTKHLINDTPTSGWWSGRSIIFPWMLRLLSPISYSELWIRVLNLFFGLGFTLTSYYLIKELFNKQYAVITGLIMSTQWVFLYWALRITIGVPSAFILALSNYYYVKKKSIISGAFLGLAFTIRFTAGVMGLVYLINDLLKKKKTIKNHYWLIGILIGMTPLMIYDLINYGNPLYSPIEFLQFNLKSSGGSQAGGPFYYFNNMLFNYGTIMGVLVFIGFIPLIAKINNEKIRFCAIMIITYLGFYSVLTSVKEVRFLIHLLPYMVVLTIMGLKLILNSITKDKKIVLQLITILTIIIMFQNYNYALPRIEQVSESYLDVKNAGLYLKQFNGTVMTKSMAQITYYSELETINFPNNYEEFINQSMNVSYIIVSAYESHPDFAYNINESFIKPLKAYPNLQETKLIIYEVNASIGLE